MAKERESETRSKRINAKLKSLGWQIVKHQEAVTLLTLQRHAVEEYPTDNGRADYALFVHGKLLGVIEAKKVAVSPQNVCSQPGQISMKVLLWSKTNFRIKSLKLF